MCRVLCDVHLQPVKFRGILKVLAPGMAFNQVDDRLNFYSQNTMFDLTWFQFIRFLVYLLVCFRPPLVSIHEPRSRCTSLRLQTGFAILFRATKLLISQTGFCSVHSCSNPCSGDEQSATTILPTFTTLVPPGKI